MSIALRHSLILLTLVINLKRLRVYALVSQDDKDTVACLGKLTDVTSIGSSHFAFLRVRRS